MLRTEARITLIDGGLATAVLVGVVLNAAAGLWWADPLAALVLVFYGGREARHAWREAAHLWQQSRGAAASHPTVARADQSRDRPAVREHLWMEPIHDPPAWATFHQLAIPALIAR